MSIPFKKSTICLGILYFTAIGAMSPIKKEKGKIIIGRIEKLYLPEFNLELEGRVDTGALSCSLHVQGEKVVVSNNKKYIEFDTKDARGETIHVRTALFRTTKIRSSNGILTQRHVIRQKVKIGPVTRLVNITLNDRTELKYSFLIGRNFLRGRFLIDVAQSHMLQD